MAESEQATRYPEATLRGWTERIFARAGLAAEDAAIAADVLVEANLRGVDTHGVNAFLEVYVRRLLTGAMNPRPRLRVEHEAPATATLDGDNGLGSIVAYRAMEFALRKAATAGAAWVGVRRTNHIGPCAHSALMAVPHDMIGIAITNSPAAMAPWGAAAAYLGTNPIAFAIPAGSNPPIVADIATSVAARGHVLLAQKTGRELPPGIALDRQGRPTTDPFQAALMMPIAQHKGSALALVFDVLAGILTGAAFGPYLRSAFRDPDQPQDVGCLFGALSIARFGDPTRFKQRVDQMITEIHALPRAEGVERIYVPGEIEWERRAERLRHGIPLHPSALADLARLGDELGVPFPLP